MMDNRIFNVNGRDKDMLLDVLKIAFAQRGTNTTAKGYKINSKKGLILYWTNALNMSAFPSALNPEGVLSIVWEWLLSKPEIECVDWDADEDHDGHNGKGWRVYCESWGHVDGEWEAIVAIKPAFMWYGK